jgi:hypothetical protein
MAQSESGQKSLEMRVAELEDKLSKVHITEEEMKAYHKVAALTGAHAASKSAIIDYCLGCYNCYRCYSCYYCSRCLTECTECIVVGPTGPTAQFGKLGS